MKIKVQSRYLKAGDITGSGETIVDVVLASIHFPSSQVMVTLKKNDKQRTSYWGKYTEIHINRDIPVETK